jgi:hypothetical protein
MFIFSSSSARVLAPRVFAAQHLLLLRPLGRRGQILTRTPASARLLVCIKPGKRKNFRKHNLANGLTPTQKNNTVAKKKARQQQKIMQKRQRKMKPGAQIIFFMLVQSPNRTGFLMGTINWAADRFSSLLHFIFIDYKRLFYNSKLLARLNMIISIKSFATTKSERDCMIPERVFKLAKRAKSVPTRV